ncbi:hypothetical protein MTO96_026836 [Rhipicephalus appendiculatus]
MDTSRDEELVADTCRRRTCINKDAALFVLALKTSALLGDPPCKDLYRGDGGGPRRDRPTAARKRLSSSVTSEAGDSESDVRSDDSDVFLPVKYRDIVLCEETVICSNTVTTTVAYAPVDVTVSLNAISKQKLHDFFLKLALVMFKKFE